MNENRITTKELAEVAIQSENRQTLEEAEHVISEKIERLRDIQGWLRVIAKPESGP